jgi:hypothetical protein
VSSIGVDHEVGWVLRVGTLKPHPATYDQKLVATGEADVSAQQRRPQYHTSEPQSSHVVSPLFRFRIDPAPYRVKLIIVSWIIAIWVISS